MLLKNCRLDEVVKAFNNKKIIFFGQGSWLQCVDYTELMELQGNFAYVIDNNPKNIVTLRNESYNVYDPEKLKDETEAIIVLISPVYMYDMYQQLRGMNLPDGIECYAFPFMQMISNHEDRQDIIYRNLQPQKIPKIIHSFWFSGDDKPDSYKKCVDSWYKVLGDYEIKEWNLSNYDWKKNEFCRRAIELEAWAFASDYARLDVLFETGGIYLDMDVEVFKPFDDLLGNKAIVSFSNNIMIDLAVVASCKGNILIKKLRDLYQRTNLPPNKHSFSHFFQPSYIRNTLAESGIKMNGSLQKMNSATVFPKEFFMPLDQVIFRPFKRTENTYCVHYDNFGWSYNIDGKREKKRRDNNYLWEEINRSHQNVHN